MRARPPQSGRGWGLFFALLVACSLFAATSASELANRTRTALFVLWVFGIVAFVLWRRDARSARRPREGNEKP